MAATATTTLARPAGKDNGFLATLLKAVVDFLGRPAVSRSASKAEASIEAPLSNDVDLWKLYWAAAASGANSAKVRQMLQRAGE